MTPCPRLSRIALALALLFAVALPAAAAPRSDPAEAAVASAFRAALTNDFGAYLALVHPSEKATPAQTTQLERYTFARFVRQAGWYLAGGDPDSFQIERREELGGGKVKLFVKDIAHPSRAPVPVTLEKSGASFLLLSNSL